MLTFQDSSEEYSKKDEPKSSSTSRKPSGSEVPVPPPADTVDTVAPEVPPKPVKTGVERIAEIQKGELNEVMVEDEGDARDYALYCTNLLEVRSLLYKSHNSTYLF